MQCFCKNFYGRVKRQVLREEEGDNAVQVGRRDGNLFARGKVLQIHDIAGDLIRPGNGNERDMFFCGIVGSLTLSKD